MTRTRVILHASASVDGRIAASPDRLLMFDERWPAPAAAVYAGIMARHNPQVLLEGAGSFVSADSGPADFPEYGEPDVPDGNYLPDAALAAATRGWLVVPDSAGRVRWAYKQFPGSTWAGWHLMVAVTARTPREYLAFLRDFGVPYLIGDDRDGHVDLTQLLTTLKQEFATETVVATGPGRLGGALLRAGLLDHIEVETLPIAVGGTHVPSMLTSPDLSARDQLTRLQLRDVSRTTHDSVLASWDVLDG